MSVRRMGTFRPVIVAVSCAALGFLVTACASASTAASSLSGVQSSPVPSASVVASSPAPVSSSPPVSTAPSISLPPISASGSPPEVVVGSQDSGRRIVVHPGALIEVDLTAPAPSTIEPAFSANETVVHRVADSGSPGPTSTARFVAVAVGEVRIVAEIIADCGPGIACQAAGGYDFLVSVTASSA